MAATAELYCKIMSPLQAGSRCCCLYLPVLLIRASLLVPSRSVLAVASQGAWGRARMFVPWVIHVVTPRIAGQDICYGALFASVFKEGLMQECAGPAQGVRSRQCALL